MSEPAPAPRWWHVYAADLDGMKVAVTVESTVSPANMPEGWSPDEWFGFTKDDLAVGILPWRASFDFKPTPAHMAALGFPEDDEDEEIP